MSDYKIEKKIPIPAGHQHGVPRYPLAKMEVGDSFFVPSLDVKNANTLRQACYHYGKKHPSKFRVLLDDSSTTVGWRVFRVK
jgi:hypothetical protein